MSNITKTATTYSTTHPKDPNPPKEVVKTVITFGFNEDGQWVKVDESSTKNGDVSINLECEK